MHILTGESALRAMRAARVRGLTIALPEPDLRQRAAYLPGQPRHVEVSFDSVSPIVGQTLADVGFDVQRAETNAKVDLWRLGNVGGFTDERPLELGVFSSDRVKRRRRLRTCVLSRDLPADSLIRIDPTLYFVCPELIVLHMSSHLSEIALAQLIMELCGSYSLGPVSDDDGLTRCAYGIPAVTTLSHIRAYANQFRHRGGTKVLQTALRLAMEGAASPAETNLALIMSLPCVRGGYGFPMPTLNAKLIVPDHEADRVGGGSYALDVFWQDVYADLEYESVEFHLDPLVAARLVAARDHSTFTDPEAAVIRRGLITKADADRRRLRDLQCLGLQVIPVTNFDLQSVHRMDQVACALARQFEWHDHRDADEWCAQLDEKAWHEARHSLLQELQPDVTVLP